jgi:hypothetical protein
MKTTRAPTKKEEKERKDKGKEKISDKKTEQEQCFMKLWETWKKMQAIGDISYFFPYYFNYRAKKSTKNPTGGKYMIFFPSFVFFSPIRPCNNCSTFRNGVIGGKNGKRVIKSYNV